MNIYDFSCGMFQAQIVKLNKNRGKL